MVVGIEVFACGIEGAAVCAVDSACDGGYNCAAKRSADPFFHVQVERLFVSRPVVLVLECIAAESAFEYAIGWLKLVLALPLRSIL